MRLIRLIALTLLLPACAPRGGDFQVQARPAPASPVLTQALQDTCAACHTGQAGAPDFRTALPTLAAQAAQAIRAGRMPQWSPAPGDVPLTGAPDQAALHALARTLEQASPDDLTRAARALTPPPPVRGPALPGLADLTPDARRGAETQTDPHLCRADPAPTGWISGVRVQPGADTHHVIFLRVPPGTRTPSGTWVCGVHPTLPTSALGSWIPGQDRLTPEFGSGTGVQLQPGEQVIVQVHLHRRGHGPAHQADPHDAHQAAPADAAGHYELLRSRAPLRALREESAAAPVNVPCLSPCQSTPDRTLPTSPDLIALDAARLNALMLGRCGPGRVTPTQAEMTCDAALSGGIITGVSAHAHALARRVQVTLTLPGGAPQTLLDIPRWDPGQQGWYALRGGLSVPRGARLRVTCTYPRLARPIQFGYGAADEMCVGSVRLTDPL